mmetsp:Transcript_20499/g.49921  ORF Transcript_20499/g.49921 Transcript_20499/m.49921 type:complete len:283 (-) Transcript_20499:679-1527(-)
MQWLSAVVASPHCNALLVQEGRQVGRVDVVVIEGHKCSPRVALCDGVRAVQPQVRDVTKATVQVTRHVLLVLGNVVHSQFVEVVHSSAQGDRLGNGWRPSLEARRRVQVRRVIEIHVLNHLASPHPRRHALEHFIFAIQHTNPSGPHHLVTRRHQPVAIQGIHVDLLVGHCLTGIDENLGPNSMALADDLCDRVAAAESVADSHYTHHLGPGRQERLERRHVQTLVLVHLYVFDSSSLPLGEELPWDDVAVMLHHTKNDLVALTDVRLTPCLGDKVNPLGCT